jgi:hypothetical protein
MRPPRHSYLVDKAIDAAIGAIEIYNKPSFRYREETFAILMLNAWELLLKARILKENGNQLRSIEVWEQKATKAGLPSKKLSPKRNRAGNVLTIGVAAAANLVRGYSKNEIDQHVVENLSLLMEIRDNAPSSLLPEYSKLYFPTMQQELLQRLETCSLPRSNHSLLMFPSPTMWEWK